MSRVHRQQFLEVFLGHALISITESYSVLMQCCEQGGDQCQGFVTEGWFGDSGTDTKIGDSSKDVQIFIGSEQDGQA